MDSPAPTTPPTTHPQQIRTFVRIPTPAHPYTTTQDIQDILVINPTHATLMALALHHREGGTWYMV